MKTILERGSVRWYSPYELRVVKLTQAPRRRAQDRTAYAELLFAADAPAGEKPNIVHIFDDSFGSIAIGFTVYRDASVFFEQRIGHTANCVRINIKNVIHELRLRRHIGSFNTDRPWCFRARSMDIWHGNLPSATKYFVRQHGYAVVNLRYLGCLDHGFLELLEILDPGPGMEPHVIHEFSLTTGSVSLAFESHDRARAAYRTLLKGDIRAASLGAPGLIRTFEDRCELPWYYQAPEEERSVPVQRAN